MLFHPSEVELRNSGIVSFVGYLSPRSSCCKGVAAFPCDCAAGIVLRHQREIYVRVVAHIARRYSLTNDRIDPSQAGELREITVCRAKRQSVFHRRVQMGAGQLTAPAA